MDEYLDIVRSMKPKPNASRRSYQPLNTQQNPTETNYYPQRASLNPEMLNSPRPSTTLVNNIPTMPAQNFSQLPVTYSVPYSISPQNIAPSTINYLQEGFPPITTTTSQFIPRPTQPVYQSSYNNIAPPVHEMNASTFHQYSQINQRNRVSPQQEGRRKASYRDNERRTQPERAEKKYNKVTRKSGRKSQKNKYLLILTGIIVLTIAVVFVYKHLNEEKNRVVFCETGDMEADGCIHCPPRGECKEGRLKCKEGYEAYKNKCVEPKTLETRKKFDRYIDFIDDQLARRRGDQQCNPLVRDFMNQKEVEDILREEFKNDPFFSEYKKEIFSALEYVGVKDGHPYLEKGKNNYKTTRKPDPSALCRVQLLWNEKVTVTLILVWTLLFVLSVAYGRRYVLKKREYQRLASELYSEILVYLSHWEKIRVKQIKKDFEEWAQGYNYRRLWRRLEEIKKRDSKIYSYLDYYQNNVEEFWMLPK